MKILSQSLIIYLHDLTVQRNHAMRILMNSIVEELLTGQIATVFIAMPVPTIPHASRSPRHNILRERRYPKRTVITNSQTSALQLFLQKLRKGVQSRVPTQF